MSISKLEDGRYKVDFRPTGQRHKRFRKTFDSKVEAKRYIAHIENRLCKQPDWNPNERDKRRLSEVADTWFELHGYTLLDGKQTLRRILAVCRRVGDPLALDFNEEDFMRYRKVRLGEGVTENTVNHEHIYVSSMFNTLIRLKNWPHANPLRHVRRLKVQERELSYLSQEQIEALLLYAEESKNPHLELIIRVCLSTGARWTEAETLTIQQVKDHRISYIRTKNRKNRTVPIDDDLYQRLCQHMNSQSRGRLFPVGAIAAFKRAMDKAGIELPRGQLSHVLRHSFASHYMLNGGNILKLQRALGHARIEMTMRYAHLSPEHLDDVTLKNPLAQIS